MKICEKLVGYYKLALYSYASLAQFLGSKESRMPKKGKKRTTDSETKENSDLDSDVEYEHVIDVAYAQENAERVSHGNQPMAEAYDTHDTTLTDKSKRVSGKNGKLNPDDFLSVESKALDVDVIITDNSDLDFSRSKNQKSLIREAFANDAVLEDFAEEKKARNEKRMPNDVDLTLPGWGEWAGADMDTEKILSRKRKKFVKKAKKPRPSKDAHLKHVIINEETNTRFTSNQVKLSLLLFLLYFCVYFCILCCIVPISSARGSFKRGVFLDLTSAFHTHLFSLLTLGLLSSH